MKIECLFIKRGLTEIPELLVAWDEYAVSENPEGWEKECNDAIYSLKDDYLNSCFLDIEVDEEEIIKAMGRQKIRGKIIP